LAYFVVVKFSPIHSCPLPKTILEYVTPSNVTPFPGFETIEVQTLVRLSGGGVPAHPEGLTV
jgi:hypothetical protein